MRAADGRLSFDNVVWVRADTIKRGIGHNYLSVFADLMAKRVVMVVNAVSLICLYQFAGFVPDLPGLGEFSLESLLHQPFTGIAAA